MKTETWVRLAAIGICIGTAALFGYVLVRYFAGILLPFLLAAMAASVLRPAAVFLKRYLRLPEKLCGTLVIAAAVMLCSFGIVSLGRYLYEGAAGLLAELPAMLEDAENPLGRLTALAEGRSGAAEHIGDAEALYGMAKNMVRKTADAAGTALTSSAASLIVKLPRLMLSVVVGVIALFYLFFDREKLAARTAAFFGERTAGRIVRFLTRMRRAVGGCLKAYTTLTILTYAELLAGFLILNVKRPAVLAAVAAAVDLLPVFGVGTVLLPWSIGCFLTGNVFRGVGLLVLFGVMYVVRQFAEPRLLSSTIGVHPLFTLFAVFAGFSLFGIFGMLAAPLLLYAVKAGIDSWTEGGAQTP